MRTGGERRTTEGIRLHDSADFEGMRRAGRLAAECLDMIGPHVTPGVRTEDLDALCHAFILDHGATPAPLGYRGFPKSVCISINHVVCHGIPGPKTLREGDILNIDVTAILEGWHGDTSRMYVAGRAKRRAARLIEVTHESLMRGIAEVRPGNHFGDIGQAIQVYAEAERCSVVRDFCGHGLGLVFHDAPNVQARHVLHHRADGEPGRAADQDPGRQLDRGHPRPLAVGPVRAFHRRDRGGLRDLHPVAGRKILSGAVRGILDRFVLRPEMVQARSPARKTTAQMPRPRTR